MPKNNSQNAEIEQMSKQKEIYGIELILDMSNCDVSRFNRKDIKSYFSRLCTLIDMSPEDLHFWDDYGLPEEMKQTNPQTKGTTAIQFLLTSNILIHTLDLLEAVFINIFSCKEYDTALAEDFTIGFFKAKRHRSEIVRRILP